MFPKHISIKDLNRFSEGTLVSHLGIKLTEVGEHFIKGTMPVDARTTQPMGLLHGGASVALAETLGSVASSLMVRERGGNAVGLEINANHVNSVRSGKVHGCAKPIHIGSKTHVWHIEIKNDNGELVCISRLTVLIV